MGESVFPPVEQMLPHRDPFLFLQSVRGLFGDRIVCRGMIEEGHYLAHDKEAPPILGIEMGAQAAGIHAALQHHDHDPEPTDLTPRAGYLVAIRQARFHVKALAVGRALSVEAIARGAAGRLATCEILVTEEGEEAALVEARISTWAAAEPGP